MKKIIILMLLVISLFLIGCDDYLSSDLNSTADTKGKQEKTSTDKITDSWEKIIESINNGSYKSKYNVGDTKLLDLGPEGKIEMQIVAFDEDELADGSGYAEITWISKQVLNSDHRMNPARSWESDFSKYLIGTGNIGGWKYSEMRTWLRDYVKPLIPSNVAGNIKPVIKYTRSFDQFGNPIENDISEDEIWIPSQREISGTTLLETEGPTYKDLFSTLNDSIRMNANKISKKWFLRSAFYNKEYYYNQSFCGILEEGSSVASFNSEVDNGVVIGFCMSGNDSTGEVIPYSDPEPKSEHKPNDNSSSYEGYWEDIDNSGEYPRAVEVTVNEYTRASAEIEIVLVRVAYSNPIHLNLDKNGKGYFDSHGDDCDIKGTISFENGTITLNLTEASDMRYNSSADFVGTYHFTKDEWEPLV